MHLQKRPMEHSILTLLHPVFIRFVKQDAPSTTNSMQRKWILNGIFFTVNVLFVLLLNIFIFKSGFKITLLFFTTILKMSSVSMCIPKENQIVFIE